MLTSQSKSNCWSFASSIHASSQGRNVEEEKSAFEEAKAASLPALNAQKLNDLACLKAEDRALKEAIAVEMDDYLKTLVSLLDALSSRLEITRHSTLYRHHQVFFDYFATVVQNIYRKLKCLELELLHHVCSGSFGQMLAAERESLESVKLETTKQIAGLDQKLSTYRGAGQDFENLLALYSRITRDIKNLEYDIAQL
ncbi:hypothetical protein BDR26DRAFT_856207, partial [Obelidium mucronatum]